MKSPKQRIRLFPETKRPDDATPTAEGGPPPLIPPVCNMALHWCDALTCNANARQQCASATPVRNDAGRRTTRWTLPVTGTLIVLFGLLQIADGVITYLGLDQSLVDEMNPLLNACAEAIGLAASIATLKLGGLAFITFLFLDRHKMKSRWITATLGTAVGFYAWVVANNVSLVMAA